LRVNEKAKSGIMSKNTREHVVLKQDIKTKNAFKFLTSKVFRSLTRGTNDRELLRNPPSSYYKPTYTAYLDKNLNEKGTPFELTRLDTKIINSHHRNRGKYFSGTSLK